MKRTKEEAEQTRQDVLDAALRVFSRDGYAAARLADIAAEANVTRGAIYHHFDGKHTLYAALLARAGEEFGAMMQDAIAQGGSFAVITRRILASSFTMLAERRTFRDVMALSLFKVADSDDLSDLIAQRREEAVSLIEGIAGMMAQGIAAGEFRQSLDPHTGARAFIAYQRGVVSLWLANPEAFDIAAEADRLADVYMRGILSDS